MKTVTTGTGNCMPPALSHGMFPLAVERAGFTKLPADEIGSGAIRNDIEYGNPATGWGSLEYPATADVWRSHLDASNHAPDSIRAEL